MYVASRLLSYFTCTLQAGCCRISRVRCKPAAVVFHVYFASRLLSYFTCTLQAGCCRISRVLCKPAAVVFHVYFASRLLSYLTCTLQAGCCRISRVLCKPAAVVFHVYFASTDPITTDVCCVNCVAITFCSQISDNNLYSHMITMAHDTSSNRTKENQNKESKKGKNLNIDRLTSGYT